MESNHSLSTAHPPRVPKCHIHVWAGPHNCPCQPCWHPDTEALGKQKELLDAGVLCHLTAVASFSIHRARPRAVPYPARTFSCLWRFQCLPLALESRSGWPQTQGTGPWWEQPLGAAIPARDYFIFQPPAKGLSHYPASGMGWSRGFTPLAAWVFPSAA